MKEFTRKCVYFAEYELSNPGAYKPNSSSSNVLSIYFVLMHCLFATVIVIEHSRIIGLITYVRLPLICNMLLRDHFWHRYSVFFTTVLRREVDNRIKLLPRK